MNLTTDSGLDFGRSSRRPRELQLTPLIDVAFILIIFFMLTTSFMKIESMELLLPSSAAAVQKAADTSLAHIYLYNDGRVAFGQRVVEQDELQKTLNDFFVHNPEQRVVVLAANKVSLQSLVEMMDVVYAAGGKSVYVRAWQTSTAHAKAP